MTEQNLPEQQPPQSSNFMVRHNDTIVGFYDNILDAQDGLNGYQMENTIAIDDILEILTANSLQ